MLLYVITTQQSNETTRIVIGCEDLAFVTCEALAKCGVSWRIDAVRKEPQRDDQEKLRASALLHLVMTPARGNA